MQNHRLRLNLRVEDSPQRSWAIDPRTAATPTWSERSFVVVRSRCQLGHLPEQGRVRQAGLRGYQSNGTCSFPPRVMSARTVVSGMVFRTNRMDPSAMSMFVPPVNVFWPNVGSDPVGL